MTEKRKRKQKAKFLMEKFNTEINTEVERKLKRLTRIPIAFIIEMSRLADLHAAGKHDRIDPGFAIVVNRLPVYKILYKEFMPKLVTLYALRTEVKDLKARD